MDIIKKNDFIKIRYTGKMDDGTVFDTTDEEIARQGNIFNEKDRYGDEVLIVGAGHVIEGLDEDFVGKDVGYSGTATIPPEKAFGIRNPELIETFPINQFKEKPAQGMKVKMGERFGVVIRVIGRTVQVDFNKFLAGQPVTYEYTIVGKVEDLKEKVSGLVTLFARQELPVEINDYTAHIEIPQPLTFNQSWLFSKRQIAHDIMKYTDVNEVDYIEKYKKDDLLGQEKQVTEEAGTAASTAST